MKQQDNQSSKKVVLPSPVDLEISDALQSGTLDQVKPKRINIKSLYRIERTPGTPGIYPYIGNAAADTNMFSQLEEAKGSLSEETISKRKISSLMRALTSVTLWRALLEVVYLDGKGNGELLTMVVRRFWVWLLSSMVGMAALD